MNEEKSNSVKIYQHFFAILAVLIQVVSSWLMVYEVIPFSVLFVIINGGLSLICILIAFVLAVRNKTQSKK